MGCKGLFSLLLLFLTGCKTFQPSDLYYDEITTDGSPARMEYGVYTPPGWTAKESLPLIIFLHGGGDNHTSFEKHGGHRWFDQQISKGEMPRVVLVTPNGRLGLWEDWADGTRYYRSWVLEKVLPKVQRRFNTLPCPRHCHLMGISMGGFGVLRFAYFAPDRFSSVSAISAPIIEREGQEKPKISWLVRLFIPIDRIFGAQFKQDFKLHNPFNAWISNPALSAVRLQLLWGNHDRTGIREGNRKLHAHLQNNRVAHDAYEYAGNHKWTSWKPQFSRVVNFLVDPAFQQQRATKQ